MDTVAYTPLGTSANIDPELEETDPDYQPFPHSAYFYTHKRSATYRWLRAVLMLSSCMLGATFLMLLVTHTVGPTLRWDNSSSTFSADSSMASQQSGLHVNNHSNPMGKISSISGGSESDIQQVRPRSNLSSNPTSLDKRPQYDSYLSSVLLEHNSQAQTFNDDDLHFPIDDQQHNSNSHNQQQPTNALNTTNFSNTKAPTNVWWTISKRNNYVTVTNYIRAMKSFNYNASVTLTTQATTEFMYHTLELCKRWDGPISVAVFCPGTEMAVAISLIKFMRKCLPGPLNACIRDKVTWHLVYNQDHGPDPNTLDYPKHHLDKRGFPLFVEQDQCPKLPGPESTDYIKQFEEELKKSKGLFITSYRKQFQLTYPINVLRNTARLAANTEYLLASDIELYPSINLALSFINYINNHNVKKEYDIEKYVFTLPIFEVKSNVSVPKSKDELLKLLLNEDAIFFHRYVCDACQNFPNRLDWLTTDQIGRDEYHAGDNEVVIFTKTLRDKTRDSWEPIFIGTNKEPLYDDRLTWEGRRDKMGQMYEMCLQNYHLLVLGNAFLVHAPGIKHIDKKDNAKRLKYIMNNNAIYDQTMLKLKREYSASGNINKC